MIGDRESVEGSGDTPGDPAPDSGHAVVLANRIPFPLDDGWKVRTFHVIREIARRVPVTFIVFETGDSDGVREAFLKEFEGRVEVVGVERPMPYTWWRLALGLVTPLPIHVWNNRSRPFMRAVETVVEERKPTLAVAVCAFMFPYLEGLNEIAHRVVDTHNVDSDLMRRYLPRTRGFFRRLYARFTVRKLRSLEDRAFSQADSVWVCSDDEERLLRQRSEHLPVTVIPNGVDVAHFSRSPGGVVRKRLLFFGKLDYFPNEDGLEFLVDEILPVLREVVDTFEVTVIGAGATQRTEAVCARCPELELVGRVDEVRPWLASADLVVVPLRMGSGTRLKVLEAMASGRPVLSTRIGAEGIVAERGREILEADSAEAFAREIGRVLDDPDLGDSVGARGQEAVRRRYDWSAVGELIGRAVARTTLEEPHSAPTPRD